MKKLQLNALDNKAIEEEAQKEIEAGRVRGVQQFVDKVLAQEETYDWLDADVCDQFDQNAVKFNVDEPKQLKFVHADDLVGFINRSEVQYNQDLNFSFMHAVFALLLEVPVFKKKFYKGKPQRPPFSMMLDFSPQVLKETAGGRPSVELSTNGMMVKFVQSALSETSAGQHDSYEVPECPRVSLAYFKRLMTELDSAPLAWPDNQ